MFQSDNALLRCIAIVLVTNSHLDHLYPWPQLGTGGSLGNALFFMISGYSLATAWASKVMPFGRWYGRRALRIYPSLVLVGVIHLVLFGVWERLAGWGFVSAFIWPTYAWFVGALMVYYALLYVIIRLSGSRPSIFLIVAGGLFLPYFVWYAGFMDLSKFTIEGPGYFKWIFYFQTMLVGAYLAVRPVGVEGGDERGAMKDVCILAVLLAVYFVMGYLVYHGGLFTRLQCLLQLITFPIVVLFYYVIRRAAKRIARRRALLFLVGLVSSLTLEIYLLQGIVYSNKIVTSLQFPFNISVFWIGVVGLSFFIERMSTMVRGLCDKIAFTKRGT